MLRIFLDGVVGWIFLSTFKLRIGRVYEVFFTPFGLQSVNGATERARVIHPFLYGLLIDV